jgi:Cu/Ag efflux pump CusA
MWRKQSPANLPRLLALAGIVTRRSAKRLAPILMTARVTGLAMLPIAVGGNKPGREIEYPLAVVILLGWRLQRS